MHFIPRSSWPIALCVALLSVSLITVSAVRAQKETQEVSVPTLEIVDGKIDVFGLSVQGKATPVQLTHAANILAQWIDNDEDGKPDNQKVVDAIIAAGQREVGIIGRRAWVHERDIYLNDSKNPWPYDPERRRFDATLEELLHCVTQYGYGEAYPEVFGERVGTTISAALDIARDSTEHNDGVPKGGYGENAWFHYDDPTCEYGGCQITEYMYWAITSLVGIQKDRCDEIGREWELCTPELMKEKDAAFMKLYNNPEYNFPKVAPDGTYRK